MVRAQWRTAAIAALVLPAIVLVASEDPAAAAVCTITGTEGDDHLTGTDGADVICGLGGDDVIVARGGADELVGGEGNDRLNPGTGDDVVDGGPGKDWVSYRHLVGGGVQVNLVFGTTAGPGGSDVLSGLENVVGSAGNDVIRTPVGQNFVRALAGNDIVRPGEGGDNDHLDGGAGRDTLNYSAATRSLSAGISGVGRWWRIQGFEDLTGSAHADFLFGNDGDNTIIGAGGNDTLSGYGGDDVLDAGDGRDTLFPDLGADQVIGGPGIEDEVEYITLEIGQGVQVDLDLGVARTADLQVDQTVSGIERVRGTLEDDVLRGGLGEVAVILNGDEGVNTLNTVDGFGGDRMRTGALHAAESTCTGDPDDTKNIPECLPQGG